MGFLPRLVITLASLGQKVHCLQNGVGMTPGV